MRSGGAHHLKGGWLARKIARMTAWWDVGKNASAGRQGSEGPTRQRQSNYPAADVATSTN